MTDELTAEQKAEQEAAAQAAAAQAAKEAVKEEAKAEPEVRREVREAAAAAAPDLSPQSVNKIADALMDRFEQRGVFEEPVVETPQSPEPKGEEQEREVKAQKRTLAQWYKKS